MPKDKIKLAKQRNFAAASISNRLAGKNTTRRDLEKNPYSSLEIARLQNEYSYVMRKITS